MNVSFPAIALHLGLLGLCAIPLSGCQSVGSITPSQVAQLNCILAADGATVVAIVRPGLALPANGLAVVGCQTGTQIGQILTPAPTALARERHLPKRRIEL